LKKGYNQVREQQYAGSMLSFSLWDDHKNPSLCVVQYYSADVE
jgi:hypothetical protein